MNVDRLLDRVRNDRYSLSEVRGPASVSGELQARELRDRLKFNHGSEHVESLILRWANEERASVALDELRDAPALDLRLRHQLIFGEPQSASTRRDASRTTPPVVSPNTGTFSDGKR